MSVDRHAPQGAPQRLRAAWKMRQETGAGSSAPLVVALRGGRGAFVRRSAARRLVTTVEQSEAVATPRGLAGWLERRQASRSAIVVVPDRATGVALALRWRLDPQRLRLAEGFDAARLGLTGASAAPWHLKG